MDTDEGVKINKRAALLQRMAAEGVTASDALSALTNALGNEAAATVKRHPNVRNASVSHLTEVLDGMLDIINGQLREFAYIEATGSSPADVTSDSPYRALNPEAFDKGAKIRRRAKELRRAAARDAEGSEAIAAIQTALGEEIAAHIARRNPTSSPDQRWYMIDQILDSSLPGVREAAYLEADLPAPKPIEDGRDLTNEEFNALTTRILHEATKNNMPVGDALSATAKAVGVLISVLSEERGASANELIKFSQNAVEEFAQEAIKFVRDTKKS